MHETTINIATPTPPASAAGAGAGQRMPESRFGVSWPVLTLDIILSHCLLMSLYSR